MKQKQLRLINGLSLRKDSFKTQWFKLVYSIRYTRWKLKKNKEIETRNFIYKIPIHYLQVKFSIFKRWNNGIISN